MIERKRAQDETDKLKPPVTFTTPEKKEKDIDISVALDTAHKQRKRQNALEFKKRIHERDEAEEVKEFMKQARIVKQRHAVAGAVGKGKGSKTFLQI